MIAAFALCSYVAFTVLAQPPAPPAPAAQPKAAPAPVPAAPPVVGPKVAVYPPDINLETSRDRQSFVVQLTQPDGITRDITEQSQITFANPALVKLDKFGYAVSTGSACASGREEPSHVLAAMGRAPGEAARVLRFSSGWETSEEDWSSLLDGLRQVRASVAETQKLV